jgi:regulator of RNase E activity RraA
LDEESNAGMHEEIKKFSTQQSWIGLVVDGLLRDLA